MILFASRRALDVFIYERLEFFQSRWKGGAGRERGRGGQSSVIISPVANTLFRLNFFNEFLSRVFILSHRALPYGFIVHRFDDFFYALRVRAFPVSLALI